MEIEPATLLQAIVALESIIVALLAEPAINRMSPCTNLVPRLAFHLLTVGAVARLYAILAGDVQSVPTAITTGGVALLLVCDRWRTGRAQDRQT
jgi:hypothetical protein